MAQCRVHSGCCCGSGPSLFCGLCDDLGATSHPYVAMSGCCCVFHPFFPSYCSLLLYYDWLACFLSYLCFFHKRECGKSLGMKREARRCTTHLSAHRTPVTPEPPWLGWVVFQLKTLSSFYPELLDCHLSDVLFFNLFIYLFIY